MADDGWPWLARRRGRNGGGKASLQPLRRCLATLGVEAAVGHPMSLPRFLSDRLCRGGHGPMVLSSSPSAAEEGATGIQNVDDLDPVTAYEVPCPERFDGSFEQARAQAFLKSKLLVPWQLGGD